MPSSRGSSQPRDRTQVSRIAGRFFTVWATREALCLGRYLGIPYSPQMLTVAFVLMNLIKICTAWEPVGKPQDITRTWLGLPFHEHWRKQLILRNWELLRGYLKMDRFVLRCAKSLQSCLTLCNPMGCSLPGSSIHGILHVSISEWDGMPKGCSWPRNWTWVSYVSCIVR